MVPAIAPRFPPGLPSILNCLDSQLPRFSIASILNCLDCPRRKQRGFMVSVSVVKVKLYPGVRFGLYIIGHSAKVLKTQALTGFML